MSDAAPGPSKKYVYKLKAANNTAIWYTEIEGIMEPAKTLIDSGSSRNFINIQYARRKNLPLVELPQARAVTGIDGEEIKESIQFKTDITITVEGKSFQQRFYAMPLGNTEVILGMTWLQKAKPIISWEDLKIRYDEPIMGKTGSIEGVPKEFQKFNDVFREEF